MNKQLRLCPNFKQSSLLKYKMTSLEEFKIDRLLEFENRFFEITITNVNLQLNEELRDALKSHPLRNLALIKCQITKLDLLPKIESLESLFLDDNKLREDQLQHLEYYFDKIELLSLMSNRINFPKLLDFVGQLKNMRKLKILNVIRNFFHRQKKQIFDCDFYIQECRQKFFENIPSLILLDGIERDKNQTEELNIYENSEEEAYYLGLRIGRQIEEGEFFYDVSDEIDDSQNYENQIQQNLQTPEEYQSNSNQCSNYMINQFEVGQNKISKGSLNIQSGDSALYVSSENPQGDQGESAFQSDSQSVEEISNNFVNDNNENKDQNSKQMEDQSEDIPNGSKKKSDDRSLGPTSIKNDEKSLSSQNKAKEKQQQKQIYAIRDIQSDSEQKKPKRKKKQQPKSNEKQNHQNKKNGKSTKADLNNIKIKNASIEDRRSGRLRNVSNDDKQQKKKVKQ